MTEPPLRFSLAQNDPNPFGRMTSIRFTLPHRAATAKSGLDGETMRVTLKVYDLLGREVATLANRPLGPGSHQATFSADGLTSGVYFYRLSAGPLSTTRKLVVMH